MACGDYPALHEYWANGQFLDGVTCPYATAMPGELFALMILAPVGLALYYASGSVKLPLVIGIIIGASVLVQVPAAAANIIGIAIILGGALAAMAIIWLLNRRR